MVRHNSGKERPFYPDIIKRIIVMNNDKMKWLKS